MEEKKCYRTFYKKKEGNLFEKIKKQTECKPPKRRCEGGVLRYDDKKTGRKAGEPCKDDVRYK